MDEALVLNGSEPLSSRTHGLIDSLRLLGNESALGAQLRDEFTPRRAGHAPHSLALVRPDNAPFPDITVSSELSQGHFLARVLKKSTPLDRGDMAFLAQELTPSINAVLLGQGAVPASVNEATHYSSHSWTRDAALVAFALKRDGKATEAEAVLWSLAEFYGSSAQRSRFDHYHFCKDPVGDYSRQHTHPHSMAIIGKAGKLEEFQGQWGHEQLDTIGWFLFLAFRLANEGAVDLSAMDRRITTAVDKNNAIESIFPLALKFLVRVEAWNQASRGPWEDILAQSRATDLGVMLSAALEAQRYFTGHPDRYGALAVNYGNDAASNNALLEADLTRLVRELRSRLTSRISGGAGALARECDIPELMNDSGMAWLLYPAELGLSPHAENAILNSIYTNMREIGFVRRAHDSYVGQDYARSNGPGWQDFADNTVANYQPAQWTLFDPLLSAFFARRYINSHGADHEALARADKHLKRALSMVTTETTSFEWVRAKKTVTVPARCLPEAYWYDSQLKRWLPNHNSPLLMANASLALALLRFGHAVELQKLNDPR